MDAEISAQIELSCKISMMLQAANYIFKPVWLLVARLLGVFVPLIFSTIKWSCPEYQSDLFKHTKAQESYQLFFQHK